VISRDSQKISLHFMLCSTWFVLADYGEGNAGSYRNLGRKKLIGAAIDSLKQRSSPVVFLVWGRHAERAVGDIPKPHEALVTSHPSPKSFRKGFDISDQFSRTTGIIRWDVSNF
jgi:uracil-DNA glycosylase